MPNDRPYPEESYEPGNCDVCGAPATKHRRAAELCGDCYAMTTDDDFKEEDDYGDFGAI